jgi:hypothetical protein
VEEEKDLEDVDADRLWLDFILGLLESGGTPSPLFFRYGMGKRQKRREMEEVAYEKYGKVGWKRMVREERKREERGPGWSCAGFLAVFARPPKVGRWRATLQSSFPYSSYAQIG